MNALYEVDKNDAEDANAEKVKAILRRLKHVNIYGTKLTYIEASNLTRYLFSHSSCKEYSNEIEVSNDYFREKLVFDLQHFEQCEELTIKHCSSTQIIGLTSLKAQFHKKFKSFSLVFKN